MEVFYFFCSTLSTFFISLLPSLFHPFKLLFHRCFSCASKTEPISCYEGTVWHERRHPIHHSFTYPVRYALIDLDNDTPPPGHLSADEARGIAKSVGPVFFLTIPHSKGYNLSAFSVYYCYDLQGSTQCLKKCICEATNAWGERLSFLFNPNSDLVAKSLHFSPFMDMLGNWTIKATDPFTDNLFVSMSVQHPTFGDYFTVILSLKRVPSSLVSDPAMFFWLMPHKFALWIYWQGFKLWWKNAPFVPHVKYTNPSYREEALIRDQKLQFCPAMERDDDKYLPLDEIDPKHQTSRKFRWISWKDSKWSWA